IFRYHRLGAQIAEQRPRLLVRSTHQSFSPWSQEKRITPPHQREPNFRNLLILLRQEIAGSDVTVRATLREHFLGETGHERGSAGTVYGLHRGAGRGDWACRSGGAVARLLPGPAATRRERERR